MTGSKSMLEVDKFVMRIKMTHDLAEDNLL